jgi:hypothetical protein
MSDPKGPTKNDEESETKEGSAKKDEDTPQMSAGTPGAKVPCCPKSNDEASSGTGDPYERWRTVVMFLTLIAATCSAIASAFSACGSWATLDANIQRDRLDQRAWVGLVPPVAVQGEVGKKVILRAVVTNTGKTPARRFRSHTSTWMFRKGEPFRPAHPKGPRQYSESLLQPGMKVPLTYDSPEKMTQVVATLLGAEAYTMYFFGELSYRDIFDRPQCTTFCIFLSPDLWVGHSCETYNEAIDGECPKDIE